jgi:hypothetical protein
LATVPAPAGETFTVSVRPVIENTAFDTSWVAWPAASCAVTRIKAWLVVGSVTSQENVPVFAMPVAMDVYGPAAPFRDSSRSTVVTAALSVAVQVMLVLVPATSVWPPFGAVRVTVGEPTSTNVAVTVLLASMTTLTGLVEPVTAPLQAEKLHPVPGLAVSWTLVPLL